MPRSTTWPWWFAIGAAIAGLAVVESGGGEWHSALGRVSAHHPRPFFIASALAVAAALAWRRRLAWATDLPSLHLGLARHRRPLLLAMAATLIAFAFSWNTWTIGGSDSHCLAAQARAFASGQAHVATELAGEAPWPDAPRTFAPVGFHPRAGHVGRFVPVCSPGYPLLLAPLLWVSALAPFAVPPVAALVCLWATARLARALDGDLAAVLAALIFGTTPVVLYQVVQPMNDVPVAALIASAAALALTPPVRPGLAGALLGLAILCRPNLAPIALAFLTGLPAARGRFLLFMLPGLALVPVLNTVVYGAPLTTGYGDVGALFSLRHVGINVARYGEWFIATSPVLALGALAPVVLRDPARADSIRLVAFLLALAAVVVACYLPYLPFDVWWYLRFLLPAMPPLAALSAAVMTRVGSRTGLFGSTIAVVVAVVAAWYGLTTAHQRAAFTIAVLEQRLKTAAEIVGEVYPNSVAIAIQPNGAISYQLERPVVSWDSLKPRSLDQAVRWLESRGTRPLIVIDGPQEDAAFRQRFQRASVLGALDWPPRVVVYRTVRVYDPDDRAAYMAGAHIPVTRIDPPR